MTRRRLARFSTLPFCLAVLWIGCETTADPPERGPAPAMPYALDDAHSGWAMANCASCHRSTGHASALETETCFLCHGQNGAPQLEASHPGWRQVSCDGCHGDATALPNHAADLDPDTFGGCAGCHGDNGGVMAAPTDGIVKPDSNHTGWQNARCNWCHNPPALHGSEFGVEVCGVCHGANGGPARPTQHWVAGCVDCHGGGPHVWNAQSHEGYETFSPQGCLNCHPDP